MIYWPGHRIKIPKLGFGTYLLKGERAVSAVSWALKAGLRHIDTAQIYENEEAVGQAVQKSPLSREDIFLTTKIWRDSLSFEAVLSSFHESLRRLKTDYVDLLLIHWPNPEIPLEETLGAFKELKQKGQIRHIGLSNFPGALLRKAKGICPEIVTNQVEYHPLLSQKKLLDLAEELKIFLTAYSPLMRGKVFQIQQMARIAERLKKSPSQIALRWLIEQKNVVAIFKAGSQKHIEENLDIFDFELDKRESEQIFRLNKNRQRLINPPFAPDWDS